MLDMNPNKTVREFALEIPGATRLFEKMGIDYCCGGNRSIADACIAADLTVEDVLNSLEATQTVAGENDKVDFLNVKLANLIDHILGTHHVFTREEIDRLGALTQKVCGKHAANHPELEELQSLFQMLSSELGPHMMKEERVLFPYILAIEDAAANRRTLGAPPFGTVTNPIRMMMFEHDNAGSLLKRMRQVTSDYRVPADACISFQTLYQALEAFEKDLHQHIHLENNILFPRAVILEANPRVDSV
jgi:regulator of cell morphogenesis and NO signaling